jgi:hypothetical protein
MKKLRLLLATCVLTVCLANVVTAGEILTPGIASPPPPPPSASAQSSAVAGDEATISDGSTLADVVISGAIEVLQSLGFLVI